MSNYIPLSEISQNLATYPCVALPNLIRDNYPQLVTVNRQVRASSRDIALSGNKKFVPSNWISGWGSATIASLLILAARYFNLYEHDGICVAAIVIFLVSLICYGILVNKERNRYHQQLRQLAAKHSRDKIHYQTVSSTEPRYPDWQKILAGKVKLHDGVSKAQVGSSEEEFSKYLSRYFKPILHPSYSFKIPNFEGDGYSADFCLKLTCGVSIIVEIDEPYVYTSGQPHHCIDVDKDDVRDRFFAEGNWLTIRFSERQVVLQPDACCYFIARVISGITGENMFMEKFDPSIFSPDPDRRWTILEAQKLAQSKYRDTYLPKLGSGKFKI
jgi:very-short-patch-repair endonuclease